MPVHSDVVIQLSKHVDEQGKNTRNLLGLASFTEKEGEAKHISVELWGKKSTFLLDIWFHKLKPPRFLNQEGTQPLMQTSFYKSKETKNESMRIESGLSPDRCVTRSHAIIALWPEMHFPCAYIHVLRGCTHGSLWNGGFNFRLCNLLIEIQHQKKNTAMVKKEQKMTKWTEMCWWL